MTDVTLYGPGIPIVDPATGLPTREEIRFRDSLWKRTGGPDDYILGLQTNLGDATAQATFRATSGTPSAGALATVLLQVRAGIASAWSTASIKLSALSGGLSRIELNADTIQLNGTVLSSGAISGAMVGSSAIATSHLTTNAATLTGVTTSSGTIAAGAASAWTLVDSFTDTFTGGLPTTVDIGLDLDNTDAGDHVYNVALTYDSTDPTAGTPPLYNASRSYLAPKSPSWSAFAKPVTHTPAAGSHTYRLYFNSDSTAVRARIWDLNYAEIRR